MNKEFFLSFYDYTFWGHRQVWKAVMQLSEEQFFRELDYSIGSICNQVTHTMGVEYWWIHFLAEGIYEFINPDEYRERAKIREKWDESEVYIRAYLEQLTPEELQREVKPKFWSEDESPIKVWQALLQVANHSTDHRAQTLAGLHRLGAPTIAQDYLIFVHGENPWE